MKENQQAYMYNIFKLKYGKQEKKNKQRKKIPSQWNMIYNTCNTIM